MAKNRYKIQRKGSEKMIWNYKLDEILTGYQENEEGYRCVICNACYTKGRIYNLGGELYDANGAVRKHFKEEHRSVAAYLLEQELNLTGVSEIQRNLLKLILEGKSDKEISEQLGIVHSTVRNHRFKLREKEKQSKLFLALMMSLEKETSKDIEKTDQGILEEHHQTATMVDDRYDITDDERRKVILTYMDENGGLKQFPAREKKKIILLGEIIKNFKKDTEYTEVEVNKVLKRIYEADYPTIRRALIEYGFMDRSLDCKIYRVKE